MAANEDPPGRRVRSSEQAQPVLEGWRKKLTNLEVELKRPRVIDVVPVEFLRDESPEREGQPTQKDDVTIRRPSGAILIIDNYEIAAISDSKTRLEAE